MSKAEKAAQALLANLGIATAPVDVDDIARRLNLVVTREHLAPDLSGLLIRQSQQQVVIGVNNAHHPRRQRFTIAHEIGHCHLEHKGDVIVDGITVNRRDGVSSTAAVRDERDANAFAAALLMPPQHLESRFLQLAARNYSQSRIVADLARTFDVSEQAMNYRLVNLGLLSSH